MLALKNGKKVGLVAACGGLMMAAMVLSGWGGGGSGSGGMSGSGSIIRTTEVGPEGGQAISGDGRLVLEIPAGALSETVSLTIKKHQPGDAPEALASDENLAYYELGPDGQVFDLPITVRLNAPVNPVQDNSTLSIPALMMGTLDDQGEPEPLQAQTVSVDVDGAGAEVEIAGELTHFSPVVLRARVISYSNSVFVVEGVPEETDKDMPVTATFTAFIDESIDNLIGSEVHFVDARVGVCPAFSPNNESILVTDAGDCFDTVTAPAFEMQQEQETDGSWGKAQHQVDLYCPGVGESSVSVLAEGEIVYDKNLFATNDSGDPTGRIVGFYVRESIPVNCVDSGGGGSTEPRTGLFSAPSGLQLLETLQVISEQAIQTLSATTAPFGMLMAGDHGSALVNGEDGALMADQSSENKAGFNLQGAQLIVREPSSGEQASAAAIVEYGVGAEAFLMNLDTESGEFGPGGYIRMGAHTDAVNVPPGKTFANEMAVTADAEIRFVTYSEDEFFSGYSWSDEALDYNFLDPVSATAKIEGGPLLVVTETGSLYFDDRASPKQEIGTVGSSPRKIRCTAAGLVCVVSDYAGDQLFPVLWDGVNAPTILDPVMAGDGPVGIDLWHDATGTGNTVVVSTGFNDNTLLVTELDSNGALVSSTSNPVEEGCDAPAHASIIVEHSDEGELMVAGSCYNSDNYFVSVITRAQ